MEIEVSAHRNDQSSRIRSYSLQMYKEMMGHYKKMCKIGSAFVALDEKKVVGSIGTYPDKTLALLGTVVVDPKYQGCGVAKSLYRSALLDLKKRKNWYYKGYTTTDKVLSLGEKMKRKISFVILNKTIIERKANGRVS